MSRDTNLPRQDHVLSDFGRTRQPYLRADQRISPMLEP